MLKHLIETFGCNQPFAISEITYKDYSQIWIYKSVAELCKKGEIVHLDRGVYYIPKKNKFGIVPFNPMKIIEKKYIKDTKMCRVFILANICYINLAYQRSIPRQ